MDEQSRMRTYQTTCDLSSMVAVQLLPMLRLLPSSHQMHVCSLMSHITLRRPHICSSLLLRYPLDARKLIRTRAATIDVPSVAQITPIHQPQLFSDCPAHHICSTQPTPCPWSCMLHVHTFLCQHHDHKFICKSSTTSHTYICHEASVGSA